MQDTTYQAKYVQKAWSIAPAPAELLLTATIACNKRVFKTLSQLSLAPKTRVLQIHGETRKQPHKCRYDLLALRPMETDFIIDTLRPMGSLFISSQNDKVC